MRRIYLVTVVVLILGTLIFAYSKAQQRRQPQVPQVTSRMTNEQRLQRTITTQQRINRYFHGSVIPKLTTCWNRVQGRGTIAIEHTYARDASGKWVVEKLAVGKSTLPRGQDAVALRCMQDAVRGSSFPVEGDDGDSKEYVVKWTWPVPFPANAVEQTRAMFAATSTSSGWGCGNAPPNCVACTYTATACVDVCTGYHSCSLGGGCCVESARCATGLPFAVAGTGVIY